MSEDWTSTPEVSDRTRTIVGIVLMLSVLYVSVAEIRYRLVHPEKTETQLFLDIPKVLTWQ